MLTLGLMEGIFSFVVITMIFVGMTDAGVRVHRLLAPPAVILTGIIACAVWDKPGARENIGQVLGLLMAAALAFFLPLAFMAIATGMMRADTVAAMPAAASAKARRAPATTADVLTVEPRKRTPRPARKSRHAA